MKRLSILLALVISAPLFAQQAPPSQHEPTAAELKIELAQAKAQIVQLEAQLHEAQFMLQLYDSATGAAKRRADDQAQLHAAQQAVAQAQQEAATAEHAKK